MDGLVDAHIHLTDMNRDIEYVRSCSMMFSCTARPTEWNTQMGISDDDARVIPFCGTHPWYCSEHDNRLLEDILGTRPNVCVGEIGLDGTKGDIELQRPVFEMQLALAEKYRRPVAIHMVRAEKEILDALRNHRIKGTILHSFDSQSYVRPFSELGCFFSISPRIVRKSDEKITMILKDIPRDRLLIESDYPDCKGSVTDLVSKLSSILSVSENELINITGRNARSVLQ